MTGSTGLERVLAAAGAESPPPRRVLAGRVTTLGGFTGPFRAVLDPPDRFAIEWETPGFRFAAGFDGTWAWDRFASVRILDPDEAARLRRMMRLDPLVSLAGAEWRATLDAGSGRTLSLTGPDGTIETLVMSPTSSLPIERRWRESFPDGPHEVVVRYDDWRAAGSRRHPFRIAVEHPELPFALDVASWAAPESEAPSIAPPNVDRLARPAGAAIVAVPAVPIVEPEDPLGGVWVRHWGIPNPPYERWLVSCVVTESEGRPLRPEEARIEYRSAGGVVKTEVLGTAALDAVRRFPVARFYPVAERFHLRHWSAEPASLRVDRLDYSLRVRAVDGQAIDLATSIPLSRRTPSTRLWFPLRGRFLIVVGHDRIDRSHVYERSQRFAIDAVPLDEEDRPLVGDGFVHPDDPGLVVYAPAGGVVVRVRDDVPDDTPASTFLGFDDPLLAIGGNGVVIDHGAGEYSMLFHLRHGSVRVALGDRVRAGQPLGRIGQSGIPGFPHLHYHLQNGLDFFGADGLPCRFANVTLTRTLMAPLVAGAPTPVPVRGFFLQAHVPEEAV